MFVLCTPAQSDAMLQELCDLEERLFEQLGLHFRMLVLPRDLQNPHCLLPCTCTLLCSFLTQVHVTISKSLTVAVDPGPCGRTCHRVTWVRQHIVKLTLRRGCLAFKGAIPAVSHLYNQMARQVKSSYL